MSNFNIKKTVYFVRHGQSEDNISRVFQSPDSPLSNTGEVQAKNVAERISKIEFETLIASPLNRAKSTAEAIKNKTGKEIEFSELFIERTKPKSIRGKSHSDKEANLIFGKWEEGLYDQNVRVEDGENFDDLIKRADEALTFLQNRHENSMVVVTHGFFMKTIIARVLLGEFLSGQTFKRVQTFSNVENTGITVLRYVNHDDEKPHWRLWIFNDHAHLG